MVNKLDEQSIGKILWKYGEEKMHKKIAHGIVFFRSAYGKIETTQQLADVISTVMSGKYVPYIVLSYEFCFFKKTR